MNSKDSRGLDDAINLGVYKPSVGERDLIRKRIKNISKIVKELKRFK